eukprot:3754577-Rhodomonas_salina.1
MVTHKLRSHAFDSTHPGAASARTVPLPLPDIMTLNQGPDLKPKQTAGRKLCGSHPGPIAV